MATQIYNTASATYSYGSQRVVQDSVSSNTVSTNLITDYAISASKHSLNSSFRIGENITYYLQISNDGIEPLYNVTISDDLGGAGTPLSYVTGSAILNLNGVNTQIVPTTVNPLSFVISVPLSAGDAATLIYIARVDSTLDDSVTEITNTAIVQANEGSESGDIITVTPSPSLTLSLASYADIEMVKSVSESSITVGEPFSYTITLTNSGNMEANNVVITDILPENFVVSSITSETNGVVTTFTDLDYSLETTSNTLTLPSVSSQISISVPSKMLNHYGVTVVTDRKSVV